MLLLNLDIEATHSKVSLNILPTERYQFATKTSDAGLNTTRTKSQPIRIRGNAKLVTNSRKSASKSSVINLFSDGYLYMQRYCNGRVDIFNQVQILFTNITLHPARGNAKATGGMDPASILKQVERDEEYTLSPGFFTVPCPNASKFDLTSETVFAKGSAKHLKDYVKSTKIAEQGLTDTVADGMATVDNHFTVALMRYEYANVYWTVMDLYDVYLMTRFFNTTGKDTQVLLTDARPRGHLDQLWSIFGRVTMLQEIKTEVTFTKLAWRYGREYSPLLQQSAKSIPDLSGFRQFVLQRLGIPEPQKPDCDKLSILYIWRRDYVAHPRNPSGVIGRKIRNEEELLKATKSQFPTFQVNGVQLDKFNVTEQLRLISQSNIYIGMHGAAMTFSIFLPPKSAVIELYPQYYKSTNWHMTMTAKWAGHQYFEWHNKDSKLEEKLQYTTVPTNVPLGFIQQAIPQICT